MPSWKELKRFCERDGWELYKSTDHYFYRKIDESGNIRHTYVDTSTVTKWETGKAAPDLEKLQKLAGILGVSVGYLTDSEEAKQKGFKIPVLGKVAAGIPIEAIEDILDWEETSEEMAKKGEYFGLKIKGNSMEPKIANGDVVIVRRQSWLEDGHIGIILVNGDEATCKKIKYTKDGTFLISLNPAYEPMFYTSEEVENLPVTILGEVIELRRSFI